MVLAKMEYNWKLCDINKSAFGCFMYLATKNGDLKSLKVLCENVKEIDPMQEIDRYWDKTLLHVAASSGQFEVFKWLIQFTNDPNMPDGSVMKAAAANGHLKIVKLLSAFTENILYPSERFGNTTIRKAAQYGHVEVVEFLSNLTMYPHTPGHMNQTPLHLAGNYISPNKSR